MISPGFKIKISGVGSIMGIHRNMETIKGERGRSTIHPRINRVRIVYLNMIRRNMINHVRSTT